MKHIASIAFAVTALILKANGAVLRPDELLPNNTLFVVSMPDWETAAKTFSNTAIGRLWRDPDFKPFKTKLLDRFSQKTTQPLEKDLGITFSDYAGLFKGQLTLAVTHDEMDSSSALKPGILLLADTKNDAERLRQLLTAVKGKWVESGKRIKTERIRGVEFTSLILNEGDLGGSISSLFQEPGSSGSRANPDVQTAIEEFEITFAQSESLLLIGNSTAEMEKVLIRQSGGLVPALHEQPDFRAARSDGFRDALAFGWIHFSPIYRKLVQQVAESERGRQATNPLAPSSEKVFAATGLKGLKSIAFRINEIERGIFAELFLDVPAGDREGVFKALVAQAKDSAPPSFVPMDAVKFSRWRLDGRKAWETFESMLSGISPELGALVQMGLAMAGKEKDPSFDLRKSLFENLGDDFIVYEKAPRSATLADLNAAPALFLVGSPNPEELALALKAGAALLPVTPGGSPTDERQFLGRKIYSIPLPSLPSVGGSRPLKRTLSFSASQSHVVLSTDSALLEGFIRSGDSSGKSLRETPGLNESAQHVGGMATGFFGFENQRENVRVTLETLKNDLSRIEGFLSAGSGRKSDSISDWLDLAQLPPSETISKYFYYLVYGGSATPQGLTWKLFAPFPPQLNQD